MYYTFIMFKQSAEIKNVKGIHVRPSGIIFKAFMGYSGKITIIKDGVSTHLRDIMTLLTLALSQGVKIDIEVEGDDEEQLCTTLKNLFEKSYEFEEK